MPTGQQDKREKIVNAADQWTEPLVIHGVGGWGIDSGVPFTATARLQYRRPGQTAWNDTTSTMSSSDAEAILSGLGFEWRAGVPIGGFTIGTLTVWVHRVND